MRLKDESFVSHQNCFHKSKSRELKMSIRPVKDTPRRNTSVQCLPRHCVCRMPGGDSIQTEVKPSNGINILHKGLSTQTVSRHGVYPMHAPNSIIMLFPTPHDPSVEGVVPSDPASEEGAEGSPFPCILCLSCVFICFFN